MAKETTSYKSQKVILSTIIYVFMIVFTLIAIVPVWLMLVNATRSTPEINAGISMLPSKYSIANWHILTGRGFKIAVGFRNSLTISACVTILCVYFSALVAYGIHVYRFKGRKVLWNLIMMLIMLPASLSFIGFCQFISQLHLRDNFIPLIIPSIASAGTVLFMKQYMDSVLSFELIEASRIDGAGEFMIFNRIIIPVLKPALATQAIFAFVGSWNNFMTPFVLLSKTDMYTLPMLVQMLRGDIYRTEYGAIYVGIAVSLIPIIIFYAFMSRYIISGLTMGSVKE
ncbi:ABC-type sugar transport system, permease component [Treponema sp. JC4]|uniref:carbohydrate ABC transporter permease n=1 Tax=Treponema sp. JC4 TaxID=1124982 RepID=UPI00025AFBAE|nr:carbohydrate ABC transporter permease [Treponema sp. JC4]EID85647.1 ABC-type sugar transport system, permease component [Treponema sp. JC4]